jgi:protease I
MVMAKRLEGKKVAVLATQGFEQAELLEPRKALNNEGARTFVISPLKDKIRAWDMRDWGLEVKVDIPLDSADPNEYDALLLPGGVQNPDKLRMNDKAVQFVRAFFEAGKPVAAICHAPWMIIEAGFAKGRTLTSWPALKTDLVNAGAKWVDEQVVTDNGLVTSRKPDDIPAFNNKMIEEFAEGKHSRTRAAR